MTAIVDTTASPHSRLRPVGVADVRLPTNDSALTSFWAHWITLVRTVTLRQQFGQLVDTGRIMNFQRAAGLVDAPFHGRYYNDSDVYKWVEAAAYAHALTRDDEVLAQNLAHVVDAIVGAQQSDGYLHTYFMFELASERWADLTNKHEMYCAGHLIQAAIAHHRATGQRRLLDAAIRFADHICATFGPTARQGTDGHQEIELAMVELFRATGDRRYLDQAIFLLEMRGQTPPVIGGSPYHQDHLPVRDQRDAVGHAVRLTYLGCGLADAALETGDAGFTVATQALWESAHYRRAYVTGGLGSRWQGEAFGEDYELPDATAYAETCAAIGSFMWSWRRLLATGDATFADAMETALYNGILAGLSLDGQSYFYQNPLADRGDHRRQAWFGTACCPPNIARLILGLPGYVASIAPHEVWVHLHLDAELDVEVPDVGRVTLLLRSQLPWHGEVWIDVREAPPTPLTLRVRIPHWATGATIDAPDGTTQAVTAGTYAVIEGLLVRGTTFRIHFPMHVRSIRAHPRVADHAGRRAYARGPLVYAFEAVDHPDCDLAQIAIDPSARWTPCTVPGLPKQVVAIGTTGTACTDATLTAALYSDGRVPVVRTPTAVIGVPYYAWANRVVGPMLVWLPETDRVVEAATRNA